jgi:hypothetical protein
MVAPDFIFYPLVLFLQEAQPFIQLIGKYLYEEHAAPQPTEAEISVLPLSSRLK